MKHSYILETITEQTLSDAELSQAHGGAAAAVTSTTSTSTPPALEDPQPPRYPGKRRPGETPPIYPFPTA
jgi:hypothetical protein